MFKTTRRYVAGPTLTTEERQSYQARQAREAEILAQHEAHYGGIIAVCHARGIGRHTRLLRPAR